MLSVDQTNLVYSNDDQWGLYQNCGFHEPLVGHEICVILMTFINIQHIDCYCNKGYKAAFSSAIGDFYLFYDEPVDMQIWAPLTRSQCRVCYSGDR